MDEPELRVVKVRMHDTGLGREAGYANDQELIDAAKKQRAKLEELVGPELLKEFDEELERRFILGD